MAYTYEWQLTGLRKQNTDDLSDVIIGTHWKVTATDEDGNQGSFDGATPFKTSQVNTGSFTPYHELTETQVLEWVKHIVSGSDSSMNYWDHIMGRIEKQISANKYTEIRVDATAFPWSPTSGSVTPGAPQPNPDANIIPSAGAYGGTPS
jgi:hypothetical protein